MRPLIAGNWKMHGGTASIAEFDRMVAGYDRELAEGVDMMVFPPATLIHRLSLRTGQSGLRVGAQDSHFSETGAYTGNISAAMIHDAGGTAVILGHSERRTDHRESNELVAMKARAVLDAGLLAIVCVGETADERAAGIATEVVTGQLTGSLPGDLDPAMLVVAYEPVWAIGTGLTPTNADIEAIHAVIRDRLIGLYGEAGRTIHILYGGSVKPGNAAEILGLANVGGALVGGASLKASDFLSIARAALAHCH